MYWAIVWDCTLLGLQNENLTVIANSSPVTELLPGSLLYDNTNAYY